MGLDMYLEKRVCKYRQDDGTLADANFDNYKSDKYGRSNSVYLTTQVGYWRKANAIHKWFVDNVQDGEDNCRPYDVTTEQLRELRSICAEILDYVNGKKMVCRGKDWEAFENYASPEEKERVGKTYTVDSRALLKAYDDDPPYLWCHKFDEETSNHLAELLPTEGGFFFGTTTYGGSYLYDIVKTAKMLDELFEQDEKDDYVADYIYQASW